MSHYVQVFNLLDVPVYNIILTPITSMFLPQTKRIYVLTWYSLPNVSI